MGNASKYLKLAEFGKEVLLHNSLSDGLPLISKYAKEVICADRCSVFVLNRKKKELWTILSDGVEKIIIEQGKGIVGQTIKEKKIIYVNDLCENIYYMSEIDNITGYKTKNIISAPIYDSKNKLVGVLELLNKEGGFNDEDLKVMKFFAQYVSGFLELVFLNER